MRVVFTRLSDRNHRFELAVAELLVGPMQSLLGGRLDPALFCEQRERRFPGLAVTGFIDRALARLRRLAGHRAGTSFHASMTLDSPPAPGQERARA